MGSRLQTANGAIWLRSMIELLAAVYTLGHRARPLIATRFWKAPIAIIVQSFVATLYFALARIRTGRQYESRGAILNPTIAANHRAVVFAENACPDLKAVGGRLTLTEFFRHQPQLAALNLETGKILWRVDLPVIPGAQNAFIVCDQDYVGLVISRNAQTVHYDVQVYSVLDGNLLWKTTQDNRNKVGGDHGEQDKHPVLVGNRLIVEPRGYDIRTGERLVDLDLGQRGYGCGTISASADALFFRRRESRQILTGHTENWTVSPRSRAPVAGLT